MFGEGEMYAENVDGKQSSVSGEDIDAIRSADVLAGGSSSVDAFHGDSSLAVNEQQHADKLVRQQSELNETIKEVVKYMNKPVRKIVEVRVFFDDGTYEVFSKGE